MDLHLGCLKRATLARQLAYKPVSIQTNGQTDLSTYSLLIPFSIHVNRLNASLNSYHTIQ